MSAGAAGEIARATKGLSQAAGPANFWRPYGALPLPANP
jgi:hypothetical protein